MYDSRKNEFARFLLLYISFLRGQLGPFFRRKQKRKQTIFFLTFNIINAIRTE